ncbi:hypothetical protein ACWEQ8_33905 [Streptomyces noursei]
MRLPLVAPDAWPPVPHDDKAADWEVQVGRCAEQAGKVVRGTRGSNGLTEHDEPDMAGTDCGQTRHHCLVTDAEGDKLLSWCLANDEPELLQLMAGHLGLAEGRASPTPAMLGSQVDVWVVIQTPRTGTVVRRIASPHGAE